MKKIKEERLGGEVKERKRRERKRGLVSLHPSRPFLLLHHHHRRPPPPSLQPTPAPIITVTILQPSIAAQELSKRSTCSSSQLLPSSTSPALLQAAASHNPPRPLSPPRTSFKRPSRAPTKLQAAPASPISPPPLLSTSQLYNPQHAHPAISTPPAVTAPTSHNHRLTLHLLCLHLQHAAAPHSTITAVLKHHLPTCTVSHLHVAAIIPQPSHKHLRSTAAAKHYRCHLPAL